MQRRQESMQHLVYSKVPYMYIHKVAKEQEKTILHKEAKKGKGASPKSWEGV